VKIDFSLFLGICAIKTADIAAIVAVRTVSKDEKRI